MRLPNRRSASEPCQADPRQPAFVDSRLVRLLVPDSPQGIWFGCALSEGICAR